MRILTWKAWALLGVCVGLGVLVYACGARAATWPFTPRAATLVMLMDKTHASPTSDGRQMFGMAVALTYRTHAGDTITVPAGFPTDLASIPRPVQGVLSPAGVYDQAALVHDLLYASAGSCVWVQKGKLPNGKPFTHAHPKSCSRAKPYTRAEADQILDDAMADLGVGAATRITIWSAVRVGGSSGWSH